VASSSTAAAFVARFGRAPEVEAHARGRVNLIGEHTDYNGGRVLPTPVPQRVRVALARRPDGVVRVWSAAFSTDACAEYSLGREAPRGTWVDYIQGLTAVVRAAGFRLGGADVLIASDLPPGAGLGSSAALEVAVLRALRAAFDLPIDDVRLAQLGQQAESAFVGAPVGIMDQLVASLGTPGVALFIDTRTLATESVPLAPGMGLVVLDTGVRHAHARGAYRVRRRECEQAAAALGVPALGDLGLDALPRLAALPTPLDRRARHVVTENARVLDAVEALRRGELDALGALFAASHASMRDDFAVSTPEVEALVAAGGADADVFGARLTGGGFGGAVVMLVRAGREAAVSARVARRYAEQTGRVATVLVPCAETP
jgi:galactokinase